MAAMAEFEQAYPPGRHLKDLLEQKGWAQSDLALVLNWNPMDVSNLILRKKKFTPEVAFQLSAVFPETTTHYWMELESKYLISQVRGSDGDSGLRRRSKIFNKFPAVEMMKRGWLQKTDDIENLESQVLTFFDLETIDSEIHLPYAAKKSNPYSETTPTQAAWILRARQLAEGVMVKKFSHKAVDEALEKLKSMIFNVEDIRYVSKVLAEAGVRLLIIEPLPGGKIDGITFWLDKNSPVIVLSLRFDRIDSFWHTLLHEMSHVKNNEGQDAMIIDLDLFSEDAPESEKPAFEQRADKDAAEFSIAPAKLDSFILRAHPTYSETKIMGFAALNQVHPGIVVGQLHHRFKTTGKGIPFTHHRKLLVKVRQVVTESALTDGYGYKPVI